MCIYCGNLAHSVASAPQAALAASHSAAASSFTSSDYYISALLDGESWTGSAGQSATGITYSFAISRMSSDASNGLSQQAILDGGQQTAVHNALDAWANVANITFSQTSSTSASSVSLIVRQADMPAGIAGWTDSSLSGSTKLSFADVVLDSGSNANPVAGSYSYMTIIHELGHALGLKHPGNYNADGGGTDGPYLPDAEDSSDVTVMSYYDGSASDTSGYPVTPMLYDIAALQFLYGANHNYNAGNTTYSLTGAKTNMTIWDGGGSDTLNSSAYTGSVTLDLQAGIDNMSRVGSTSSWVAFNADIENATSGSGADFLYGNTLGNILTAGSGTDVLFGYDGADTLYGNLGADRLLGGAGSDTLYGGKDNDTLYGGSGGADTADSADLLYGGEASDVIYGNAGNDTIYGGIWVADPLDAADMVYAGFGNDVVYGNAGNDTIYGNAGSDTLYGGLGMDVFVFLQGDGVDVIIGFRPEDDTLLLSSAIYGSSKAALSHVSYNAVGAVVDLGSTNSITITGMVPGSLTVADFIIG